MPWKDEREPTIKLCMEDMLMWFKSSSEYKALDTIDGEPMEFEWNIFPGCTTLQLVREVQEFLSRMSVKPEKFTGRIIFMSMFNDISWGSKDNEQECELSALLVSIYATRFSAAQWSFLGPGSEKKWYSYSPQGAWDRIAEQMEKKLYSTHEYKSQGEWDRVAEQIMIKFAESGHPVFPYYKSIVTRNAQKQR